MVITTVTVIMADTAVTVLTVAMAVMVITEATVRRRTSVSRSPGTEAVIISVRTISMIRIDTFFIYRVREEKGMEVIEKM
jgi:hypothetical protein